MNRRWQLSCAAVAVGRVMIFGIAADKNDASRPPRVLKSTGPYGRDNTSVRSLCFPSDEIHSEGVPYCLWDAALSLIRSS